MECSKTVNGIKISGVKDLDLGETLDCGQSFRWKRNDNGSFSGVAFNRAVTMDLIGTDLYIDNAPMEDYELWYNYLDLQLDYGKIRDSISNIHPVLKEASAYAPGIRILRQDPWEALCTFIISQNNNIKRIKGIVERLCENFGEKLPEGEYTFPTAEKLSALSAEDLAPIRAGFRNKYIIDGAQKVSSGEVNLNICYDLPYDDARQELMKI
ncbi:MAG: DNA glycosylase, partial [Oscillospiraceae bacterium]|nr:DNA glycosylase [Oscillospiraceae bacterium]